MIAILLILVVAVGGFAYFYMRRRRSGKDPSQASTRDVHNIMNTDANNKRNGEKQAKLNSGSDTDDETPANSPMKAVYDPADPYGYSAGVSNPYGYRSGGDDGEDGDDGASVISSAAGSVASSFQNIAQDIYSQLNSVLGGGDDDVIRQVEDDEESADASLAPVVDRKLD